MFKTYLPVHELDWSSSVCNVLSFGLKNMNVTTVTCWDWIIAIYISTDICPVISNSNPIPIQNENILLIKLICNAKPTCIKWLNIFQLIDTQTYFND